MTEWKLSLRTWALDVALEAEQLGILALVVHGLDPLLGDGGSALGVVGDYLGNGDAGGVDLTVDEEAGDASIVSGLDGLDGGRRRRRYRG